MAEQYISRLTSPAPARAFTLVELMVAVAIIVLIVALAGPSTVTLFTSGAESQAYNLLSANLTAARALAIRQGTYAGVHVQIGATDTTRGKCYLAVVWDDPSTANHDFSLAEDYAPKEVPGGMAFGEVRGDFFSGTNYDVSDQGDFTTFTIVFTPDGTVTRSIQGGLISFDQADSDRDGDVDGDDNPVFRSTDDNIRLWNSALVFGAAEELGAAAVTSFNYAEATGGVLNDYLNAHNAEYIPVNMSTGQLFPRE
jgi:prepilin-type N-terminal cleavage/methylation domain-containing protein